MAISLNRILVDINIIKVRSMNKLMTYQCLDLCIKLASSVGLWCEEDASPHDIRHHLRYLGPRFFITTAIVKLTCVHVYDIYITGLEPITICEDLMQIFMFLVCIVKVTNVLVYLDKIQNMATTLQQMESRTWRNASNDEQLILNKTRLMTNGISLLYPVGLTIAVWFNLVVLTALAIKDGHFLFSCHYPDYLMKSPYYELLNVLVCATNGVEMMYTFVCDLLIMTMMLQLNGLLSILRYRLTNIRQLAENGNPPEKRGNLHKSSFTLSRKWRLLPDASFRERTVLGIQISDVELFCRKSARTVQYRSIHLEETRMREVDIKMQQLVRENAIQYGELISLADELDSVYSPMILMQFMFNVIAVTAAGLILTTLPEFGVKGNAMVSFLLGGTIVFFLCSALSAELTSESDQVRDALFNCDWLGASDSFKRSMRIIMCRANKPVTLMIGGFIKLSLEEFYEVSKLAYSYYQVLRTIIANHELKI